MEFLSRREREALDRHYRELGETGRHSGQYPFVDEIAPPTPNGLIPNLLDTLSRALVRSRGLEPLIYEDVLNDPSANILSNAFFAREMGLPNDYDIQRRRLGRAVRPIFGRQRRR